MILDRNFIDFIALGRPLLNTTEARGAGNWNGDILTSRASSREESESPPLPSEENMLEILAWILGPSLSWKAYQCLHVLGVSRLAVARSIFETEGTAIESAVSWCPIQFLTLPYARLEPFRVDNYASH